MYTDGFLLGPSVISMQPLRLVEERELRAMYGVLHWSLSSAVRQRVPVFTVLYVDVSTCQIEYVTYLSVVQWVGLHVRCTSVRLNRAIDQITEDVILQ